MKRTSFGKLAIAAAAAGAVALLGTAAQAQIYWDINGVNAGATDDAGGVATGVWDAATLNWTLDSAGVSATQAYVAGSGVVFSAGSNATGASTVTVDQTQTATGITFKDGNVTLTGGQIDLASPATLQVDAATARIDSVLGGTAGLEKTGSGILTLGGVNTNTGLHKVTAGTLRLGAAGVIADAADVSVAAGATLDLNNFSETVASLAGAGNVTLGSGTLTVSGANPSTFSGGISGTGGLSSASILTLSGANTYSGATAVNGGTLRAGAVNAFSASSAHTVATGATLDLNNFDNAIGTLAGAGNVSLGSATLSTGGTANTTFSGVVSGSGGLTKGGTSTQTLSGANTYTGATTINSGVIAASNAASLGASSAGTTVAATGAALQVTGTITIAEPITINGTGISNAGALRKTTNNVTTLSGLITLGSDNSRINSDAGTLTLSGGVNVSVGTNRPVTFGGAGNITVSSIIGGGGTLTTPKVSSITKDGAGTLTLSSNNEFTGPIIISGGVVSHNGEGAATAGSVSTSGLIPNGVVANYIQLSNGAVLRNTRTGSGITALATNKGITLGTGGGTWDDPNADASNPHIYSGVITGTGPFNKTGAGVLAITAAQTYSGATNINGGSIRLRTNANLLPDGSDVTIASGAVLDVANFAETIGSLGGAGTVVTTSGSTATLTAGGSNANTTFSGNFSVAAAHAFTKTGTGTMIMSGSAANLNTGTTTVSGGTLALAKTAVNGTVSGTTLAIGAGTVRLDASDQINDAAAVTMNNAASVFNLNGFTETVQRLTGTSTGAQIQFGTGDLIMKPTATGLIYSGSMSGTAGSTLTLDNAAGEFRAGSASQVFTFEKLILTSGLYRIGTGTTLGQDTQLGAIPGTTLADAIAFNGGVLSFAGGHSLTNITTAATRGITLNAGGGTLQADISNATIPGPITGVGNLTKTGALALTLSSAANDYTGNTAVNAGRLTATNTGALPGYNAVGKVSVAAGATLAVNVDSAGTSGWTSTNVDDLRSFGTFAVGALLGLDTSTATGNSFIYPSNVGGTIGLAKLGANTLVLNGANTYAGGTVLQQGTTVAGNKDAFGTGDVNVIAQSNAVGTTPQLQAGTALTGANAIANNIKITKATFVPAPTSVATLELGGANNFDLTGVISDAAAAAGGAIVKSGTGTVTLSGTNTYTGATTINGGRLQAAKVASLPGYNATPTPLVTVANGGTLGLNVGGAGEFGATELTALTASFAAGSTLGLDTTNAGGTFTHAAVIAGLQGLNKLGTGTLEVTAANTYSGGTTVSAGTLVLGNADATAGGSVNVADGALGQAQAGLTKAVTVTSLTTNASGKFDLTNNSMVVKGMPDSAVRTLLQAGYNAGAWNGPTGIVSTSITPETSIGYATKAQTGITDFKGVTGMADTDVQVKFTYAGDANLDGKVDIGDLGLLAGAWQAASGKVWFDGDFTYDGAVDIGDLGLLSGNWQKGTAGNPNPPLMDFSTAMAQFSAFDGVVVPEPTSLGLLGVAGIGLLARRRRRSN